MGCGPCADKALFLIGEPKYDPSHTYAKGEYVVVAGFLYVSLQDSNTGHNPQEYPVWWTRTDILDQLEEKSGLLTAVLPVEVDGAEVALKGLSGSIPAGKIIRGKFPGGGELEYADVEDVAVDAELPLQATGSTPKLIRIGAGRFAQAKRELFGYADFDQADGVLNGTLSNTDQLWTVTGPGADAAAIVDGLLVCDQNFYAYLDFYGAALKAMSASVSFVPGTGANNPAANGVTMIADNLKNAINNVLHVTMGLSGWVLTKRVAGGSFDVVSYHNFARALPMDGKARSIRMEWDTTNHTVSVTGPDGITITRTDSDIGTTINPRFPGYQILPNSDQPIARFHSVRQGGTVAPSAVGDAFVAPASDLTALQVQYDGSNLTRRYTQNATLSGPAGWYRIAVGDENTTNRITGMVWITSVDVTGRGSLQFAVGSGINLPIHITQILYEDYFSPITQVRASYQTSDPYSFALDIYKTRSDDCTVQIDYMGQMVPAAPTSGATAYAASKTLVLDGDYGIKTDTIKATTVIADNIGAPPGFYHYETVSATLTGAAGWYRIATAGVVGTFGLAGQLWLKAADASGACDAFLGFRAVLASQGPQITQYNYAQNVAPPITQCRLSFDPSSPYGFGLDIYKAGSADCSVIYTVQGDFTIVSSPTGGATAYPSTYSLTFDDSNFMVTSSLKNLGGNSTATLTTVGFSGTVTTSAIFVRNGNIVTMHVAALTGTSNTADFELHGLPASLIPVTSQFMTVNSVTNNGVDYLGRVVVHTDGVMYMACMKIDTVTGGASQLGWVTSGTKAMQRFTITYLLT